MAYSVIKKPSDYFNTKLYTGTSSTNAQTGVGFQPDLVWLKRRDDAGRHRLFDAVRGATKSIRSDDAEAEITRADSLTSFDSDGFTLGADSSSGGINVNISGETMVGWSWRGSDSSAVSNTDGSITSTVSANTTSGFSIVSYAGSASNITVGHGLGAVPKMMIFKNRSSATSWTVYHESIGNANRLVLNNTGAQASTNQFSFGTSPTSSVFALGGGYGDVNTSGANYIAYCFAEKQGFSKFGSYTGNGNADGTFIYTGFKPAFVLAKPSSIIGYWSITDNKRVGYNSDNKRLYPNSTDIEESQAYNLLSNGFKVTNTSGTNNTSGATYIYMAFAEEPLVGDNPATAR